MLTLDVEDWEHANFFQLKGQEAKIRSEVRTRMYGMDQNTDRWIELLGKAGARSTCFVLGEFAQRYPHAVRKLDAAGHEIASHGNTHDLIYEMSRENFREYLKKGIGVLGELTGKKPVGFRAPSWSVDRARTPWFIEELAAQGLKYDSSEFPVRTHLYGSADAKLAPYREGGVLRVPVTVLTAGPIRLPFASGAFFRLVPLPIIEFGLKRAAKRDLPVMVVLHPRELDPDHPRLPLKGFERSIHYAQLRTTVPKLNHLLSRFQWRSILETFRSQLDN
jgi:polysaccharide deacetylase family protein (PEP-CTERM system associated)